MYFYPSDLDSFHMALYQTNFTTQKCIRAKGIRFECEKEFILSKNLKKKTAHKKDILNRFKTERRSPINWQQPKQTIL